LNGVIEKQPATEETGLSTTHKLIAALTTGAVLGAALDESGPVAVRNIEG